MRIVTDENRRVTSNTSSGYVYLNIYKAKNFKLLGSVNLTPGEARKLGKKLLKYSKRVGK